MVEELNYIFFKNDWVWKLEDGRYWYTKEAKFITEEEADAWRIKNKLSCIQDSPVDKEQNHSLQGLIEALDFYNLPKGELSTKEELMCILDEKRNVLISETDYLVLPDYPIDETDKIEVIKYRKALRDILNMEGAPFDGGGPLTPWPDVPAIVQEKRNRRNKK